MGCFAAGIGWLRPSSRHSSKGGFDQAAVAAYLHLRETYPQTPVDMTWGRQTKRPVWNILSQTGLFLPRLRPYAVLLQKGGALSFLVVSSSQRNDMGTRYVSR
jgi:hypothetical protein